MKGPPYWNRRETDITPNGFFTVMKSSGWFSAARLPAGFRYLVKGPPKPAGLEIAERVRNVSAQADGQSAGMPPQILAPESHDHFFLLRFALIVLAAATLTWLALLAIGH